MNRRKSFGIYAGERARRAYAQAPRKGLGGRHRAGRVPPGILSKLEGLSEQG